jgi:formamidopyrimidine-DNA glycosylase
LGHNRAVPELPEVESVCRLMRRVLVGRPIVAAEVPPDEIVLCGTPPDAFREALVGRIVTEVGRKGKFWWLEFEGFPWVYGHLGMSGWIRELGQASRRLHAHGEAPLDDKEGRPRFLKLLLEVESGERIAFTDGRRLGRLWVGGGPKSQPQIAKLGADAWSELPPVEALQALLARRKAPIKAALLDQGLFAGIGNYLADEVLYQSRISPRRTANTLASEEVAALRSAIENVLRTAIDVDADYERFPSEWLFHVRWGGGKGQEHIEGQEIVRETIGGRTTAWVPSRQR